jgi:hypothetical protein
MTIRAFFLELELPEKNTHLTRIAKAVNHQNHEKQPHCMNECRCLGLGFGRCLVLARVISNLWF